MKTGKTRRTALLAMAIYVVLMLFASLAVASPRSSATRADDVVFTLTDKNGNATTYTMAQLKALPAYVGYAGYKDSANTLNDWGLHPVKGVKLIDLLAAAGYDYTTDVKIVASDGYNKLFAPSVVQGVGIPVYTDVTPYPSATLPSDITLRGVIVYQEKFALNATIEDATQWSDLSTQDGPLRLWWAYDARQSSGVGYVVDGEICTKWVNGARVMGGAVAQWSVTLKGPKKTTTITRTNYESCTAPGCHGQKTVKYKGHRYTGLPLYYIVGKVDDNKDTNNFGDFNVKLARKGYKIQFVNKKGAKVSISSKLLVNRPLNIILAWKKDGKELTGTSAPLWLAGPATKITAAQRIKGVTRMNLRNVPR